MATLGVLIPCTTLNVGALFTANAIQYDVYHFSIESVSRMLLKLSRIYMKLIICPHNGHSVASLHDANTRQPCEAAQDWLCKVRKLG